MITEKGEEIEVEEAEKVVVEKVVEVLEEAGKVVVEMEVEVLEEAEKVVEV